MRTEENQNDVVCVLRGTYSGSRRIMFIYHVSFPTRNNLERRGTVNRGRGSTLVYMYWYDQGRRSGTWEGSYRAVRESAEIQPRSPPLRNEVCRAVVLAHPLQSLTQLLRLIGAASRSVRHSVGASRRQMRRASIRHHHCALVGHGNKGQ